MSDIIVIGAGPAGIFTAFQAGMLKMRCTIIDIQPQAGGQCSALYPTKPIYDIPGYPEISGQGLVDKLKSQSDPFKPEYMLDTYINEIKYEDGQWKVTSTDQRSCVGKALIIAGGHGAFVPNKPPLADLEKFEDHSVFYSISDPGRFADRQIAIAGGGDSAADWTIDLAGIAKKIYLIHRRQNFRCAPQSLSAISTLVGMGKVEILSPCELSSLQGEEGALKYIEVKDINTGVRSSYPVDALLMFFGLKMNLGPILDWGIEISGQKIPVNPATMETNLPKVYAVGDIASYPGKLKLILTAFSEVAVACHHIRSVLFPDHPLNITYSTTKGVVSDF